AERIRGAAGADRGRPGFGKADPLVRDFAARVEHDHYGDARDREVADLALELEVRAPAPGSRLRDADLREDLVGRERGGKRVDEELVDGDHPFTFRSLRHD